MRFWLVRSGIYPYIAQHELEGRRGGAETWLAEPAPGELEREQRDDLARDSQPTSRMLMFNAVCGVLTDEMRLPHPS